MSLNAPAYLPAASSRDPQVAWMGVRVERG
jgi:hypothetical protein